MTTLTKAGFGRLCGLSRAKVDRLLEAGLPHTTTGDGRAADVRVDSGAAMKWLAAYVVAGPPDADAPSLDQARTALALAQARLAEMKLGALQGDLISIGEFMPCLERAIAAARAKLLAVPTKLAPVVAPADPNRARQLLERAMLEVLAELASALDDVPPPPEPWEPSAEPAA